MSAETRKRISAVISELDYRPNALARSLKQKKTHTIAAVIANIMNPFSTSVIRGAEDCCKDSGFNLILCNADDNPGKEKEYLEILMAKQIDGLIINTTGHNNPMLKEVTARIPIVLIDRKAPELNSDTVTVNNLQGVKLAIDHLIHLGYMNIAMFIQPLQGVSPRWERVEGYKQALARHGLPYRPELLFETDFAAENVTACLNTFLGMGLAKPLAVFSGNNLMTMAIIKALKAMGLAFPADLAVIGFDDWEWAPLLDSPVTVVSQPAYEMGRKAAAMLIARLKGKKNARKPSLIVYEPELIIRKSCGE